MKINIEISNKLMKELRKNSLETKKFILSLRNSSIFINNKIYSRNQTIIDYFNKLGFNILFSEIEQEYSLRLENLCIFDKFMLENLTHTLHNSVNFQCIIPNIVNHSMLLKFNEKILSIKNIIKYSPISIYKTKFNNTKYNNVLLAKNLKCAILKNEEYKESEVEKNVTSIVRFHENGEIDILKNALLSLISQYNCIPNIILALQNISISKFECLIDMLDTLPWQEFKKPEIFKFTSRNKKDIRSKLFNESFKIAITKYVAFLDYDDIIFNNAYHFLVNRLKETNKNATFGYVYASIYNLDELCITERIKKYEKEFSYEMFLMFNLFPIHSIMFNKELISVNKIKSFDKMKYMEDYYFTLQIFNEKETDWEAFKLKQYIGDYIHYPSNNTLAIISEEEKEKIKNDLLYIWCKKKINIIKSKKNKKKNHDFFNLYKTNNFEIVCFGASKALINSLENLNKLKIKPNYICDNDTKKHQTVINGYKIYSPTEIFNIKKKYIVIITSMYYDEISKQLHKYSNVKLIISYYNLEYLLD